MVKPPKPATKPAMPRVPFRVQGVIQGCMWDGHRLREGYSFLFSAVLKNHNSMVLKNDVQ